ncbi:MAG: hypothetical protein LBV00_12010 [Propionibacteriaceae bacterium]|jgi:adenylate kinase family enzyme|nr:hypothetical protein [Propionibacteriaceae bacterium]
MSAASVAPRRIRVVGPSGAGKTTYVKALAQRLGLPDLELDAVFWDADWAYRDLAEARGLLAEFLDGPGAQGWVIDGSWRARVGTMLDDAEVILVLAYPRRLVMRRVILRTVGRALTRRELWHGNRERWRNLVSRDPDESVIVFSWRSYRPKLDFYEQQARADPRWVLLRTPRAARRWMEHAASLSAKGSKR